MATSVESWKQCVDQLPRDLLRDVAIRALDRLFQSEDEYGEDDVRFLESDPDRCSYMIRRGPSSRWTDDADQSEEWMPEFDVAMSAPTRTE